MTPDEAEILALIREVKADPKTRGHGLITIRITDGKCVFARVEKDVKINTA